LERDVAIELVCGLVFSHCCDWLSAQSRPERQGDLGGNALCHDFLLDMPVRMDDVADSKTS
jgi:hypothetical protein